MARRRKPKTLLQVLEQAGVAEPLKIIEKSSKQTARARAGKRVWQPASTATPSAEPRVPKFKNFGEASRYAKTHPDVLERAQRSDDARRAKIHDYLQMMPGTIADSPTGQARLFQHKLDVLQAGYDTRMAGGAPLVNSVRTIMNIPGGLVLTEEALRKDSMDAALGRDATWSRTRHLAKAVGEGTVESLQHPGRDPAAFLLSAFGVASLGATGVAKLSVASRLAAEGRYAEAAKAIGRKPPPGPRVIRDPASGFETRGTYSRNALTEAWQRMHDSFVERAGVRSPLGMDAKMIRSRIGRAERKKRIARTALQRAEAVSISRYHLTTPQQMALRLVAENVSPAERIAVHKLSLDDPDLSFAARQNLRKKIKLVQMASKYVEQGPDGLGFSERARKGRNPLASIYDEVAAGAAHRDEIITRLDALTPEQMQERVHAPGRVYRGATYVEPTRARMGIPSPQLIAKRRRVAKLEQRYQKSVARASERAKKSYVLVDEHGREKPLRNPYEPPQLQTRVRTPEEAYARLRELEKMWDGLVRQVADRIMAPEERAKWAAFQNRQRKLRGVRVKKTIFDEAAGMLLDQAEKGKGPESLKLRALLEERDRIQTALSAKGGESFGFTEDVYNPADLGTTVESTEPIPRGYRVTPTDMPKQPVYEHPTVRKFGAALSVARDELASAEKAAARRERPVGLVGGTAGPPGRFRVAYKRGALSLFGFRPPSMVGGAGYIAHDPLAPAALRKTFKGGVIHRGGGVEATTRLVAQDLVEIQNYATLLDNLDRYREFAHPGPKLPGDIPIRLKGGELSASARALLKQEIDEPLHLSRAERKELGADFEEFRRSIFPNKKIPQEAIDSGEIGYINEKLLGGANKPNDILPLLRNRGTGFDKLIEAWDALNSTAKLILIYAKIGYIPPNLLGNVFLNMVQQGPLAIPNLIRASTLSRTMGTKMGAWMDSVMGAGIARGIITDSPGVMEAAASKVADVISIPTDRYTRRASLIYELRRKGYATKEQIESLRKQYDAGDEMAMHELEEIVTRARENAIEYENLTPLEKSAWRRLIFIYPWVKGSITYTGRFLKDHPVQAALYYQLGQQGTEWADSVFGPRPSYMEGVIPGNAQGTQVIDPRGAAIFQTFAEALETGKAAATGEFPKSAIPSDWLAPFGQLGIGYAMQVNPQTREKLRQGSSLTDFLYDSFLKSTPQAQVINALRGEKPPETGIYQRTPEEVYTKALLGGIAKQTISKENLNSKAIDERLELMSKTDRARFYTTRDRSDMLTELKRVGAAEALAGDRLEPKLRKAWDMRTAGKVAVARIRATPKHANEAQKRRYQRQALAVEMNVAIRFGTRTRAQKEQAVRWARTASAATISNAREELRKRYLGYGYIKDVKAWAEENHGASF